jgi:hypothetical protein
MTSFKGHLIFHFLQQKIIDRIHRIEDDKGFQLIQILYLMISFLLLMSQMEFVFLLLAMMTGNNYVLIMMTYGT